MPKPSQGLRDNFPESRTVSKTPSALYFPVGMNCCVPEALKRKWRRMSPVCGKRYDLEPGRVHMCHSMRAGGKVAPGREGAKALSLFPTRLGPESTTNRRKEGKEWKKDSRRAWHGQPMSWQEEVTHSQQTQFHTQGCWLALGAQGRQESQPLRLPPTHQRVFTASWVPLPPSEAGPRSWAGGWGPLCHQPAV